MQPLAHRQSHQPPSHAALRALLGLSLSWLFALAFAPDTGSMQSGRVPAELRLGAERPAQVADLASQQPSLRLLSSRARSTPDHQQAAAGGFAAFAPPLRALAAAEHVAAITLDPRARRTIRCTWPLPRSSCDQQADDAILA